MDNVRSPIVLIILGRRLSTGRDLITMEQCGLRKLQYDGRKTMQDAV